jgi:hypothetical protein
MSYLPFWLSESDNVDTKKTLPFSALQYLLLRPLPSLLSFSTIWALQTWAQQALPYISIEYVLPFVSPRGDVIKRAGIGDPQQNF